MYRNTKNVYRFAPYYIQNGKYVIKFVNLTVFV